MDTVIIDKEEVWVWKCPHCESVHEEVLEPQEHEALHCFKCFVSFDHKQRGEDDNQ